MKATVTIRLPEHLVARLKAQAAAVSSTPSEIIRAALERELATSEIDGGPTAYERTRSWVGSIRCSRVAPARNAREELERWDPDRRA